MGADKVALSPAEVVDRAATLIAYHGNTFADFRVDDSGDEGTAARARTKVVNLLNGRVERWEDAAHLQGKAARSILQTITSSIAWNVDNRPHQLVTSRGRDRYGLKEPLLNAEYVAAGLRVLLTQGESGVVVLEDVVTPEHVASLQMLIDAGRAMSQAEIKPILAKPLSFLEVADVENGLALDRRHVEVLVAMHYAALNDRAARACAEVVQLATAIIERVDVDGLNGFDTRTAAFPGVAATPADCIARGRLIAPFPNPLKEACLMGNHAFDEHRFRNSLRTLALGGFVDTPRSREEAVDAACECVGAYVEGLRHSAGYARFHEPYDAERVQTLCDELAILRDAVGRGPLGAEVRAKVAAFGYDTRLSEALETMSRALNTKAASGNYLARATLAAIQRLRA